MTEDEIASRLDDIYVFNLIGAKGFLDKLRSIGLRVIEDQPDHIVEFRKTGWQIQHSLDCRIAGKLLDCPLHEAVVMDSEHSPNYSGLPEFLTEYGRYKVSFNEIGETYYERLP